MHECRTQALHHCNHSTCLLLHLCQQSLRRSGNAFEGLRSRKSPKDAFTNTLNKVRRVRTLGVTGLRTVKSGAVLPRAPSPDSVRAMRVTRRTLDRKGVGLPWLPRSALWNGRSGRRATLACVTCAAWAMHAARLEVGWFAGAAAGCAVGSGRACENSEEDSRTAGSEVSAAG